MRDHGITRVNSLIDKIKRLLTVFDLSGGTVMGLHTLVLIGLSIAAFITKRSIDSSIQTVYGLVLGCYSIHRTTTAVTNITSNSSTNSPNDPK